jgi:meso-butanediol dehydrogenase / (S,S)-butanediol dehydrogenase / diacetyl reductase
MEGVQMLEGKVAIVTGGGSGIGRAIALRLAKEGADVAVADINIKTAEEVAQQVQAMGRRGMAMVADVTHPEECDRLVSDVVASLGHLDIMIANAGITLARSIQDSTEDIWDRTMDLNAKGIFFCSRAAALQMIKQGHGGKIIAASSGSGRRGSQNMSVYSASKFAVVGIIQSFARELASYKITANAYCPGIVDTPMWAQIEKDLAKIPGGGTMADRVAATPLGRVQVAEDVADLVSFLASPSSDFMTGQSLIQDGGRLIM